MKTASVISTGLHVTVLLWATLSFTGESFKVTPAESLPVDLISDKEFSELTKGVKTATKVEENPKPMVEKVADEVTPIENPKLEASEKPEIRPTMEKVPEPEPQPTPDPIAEKIEKQEKQEAKVEPQPLPRRKPPVPRKKKPKFDADKIAALLDQRNPQRQAATGAELNSVPSLGASTGLAARLSQSELDALRARLMSLWNPPVGIQDPENYVIRIRIRLGRDGKLTSPPALLRGSGKRDNLYETAAASALRAVYQGQPFDMLKPEHYEQWKDIEVTFDPRDMFHG